PAAAFTPTIMGTASSSPHMSHTQPQTSTLTNTATVFSSPARLIKSGVMMLPSTAATTSAAPPAAPAIASVLNCRNPASAINATAVDGPMNGTMLSAPAINPHTTALSTPRK